MSDDYPTRRSKERLSNRREREEMGYEGRRWIGWGLGMIALLAGAGAGLSYCSMAANVATTPARVVSNVASTQNVLNSYNAFYTLNARYIARVQDIHNYVEVMAEETDPDQARIQRINIVAMRTACRDLVTRYNASAENLTSSWFRDGRLPQSLDMEGCNQ